MTHNSTLENRLELIHEVAWKPSPTSFDVDHTWHDKRNGLREEEVTTVMQDRRAWVADRLAEISADPAPEQDEAARRPHKGKCGCKPLSVPDAADRVVQHELAQAAQLVRAAEERRDRLVLFAAQATSLGSFEIAQASGLNLRTVQRRIAEAGPSSDQARDYVTLRLADGQEQVDQPDHAQALARLGRATTKGEQLSGEELDTIARTLGVSRRTVQRWVTGSRRPRPEGGQGSEQTS